MLTQLSTQRALFPRARARMSGVAWRCEACRVWWGSQNNQQPTTQFLLHLPEGIAQMLPWDEYRGWQLQVERAGICPECRRPTGRVVYAQA